MSTITQRSKFWYNVQVLRLASAYSIVYIHLWYLFHVLSIDPAVREIFRFGTDVFVVVAGFMTAHVLQSSSRSAKEYTMNRIVRIVPLYWIFTSLAFVVKNVLMTHHHQGSVQLILSLFFIPYGTAPVLHPAWTLTIIVEFSLIAALFHGMDQRRGIYLAAAAAASFAVIGALSDFRDPALVLYTNPMLVDFAFGVGIFALVGRRQYDRRLAGGLGGTLVVVSLLAITLRPFLWPDAPRLLGLGVPAAGVVLGAALIEQCGLCIRSAFINTLAKCAYAMYLTHWFWDIVAEKLVLSSSHPKALALLLLLATAPAVTLVAWAVFRYVEAPLTATLSHGLAALPAAKAAQPCQLRTSLP